MSEKSVASLLSKVSKETRDWKVLFDTRAVSPYPHRRIGGDNDKACCSKGMYGEISQRGKSERVRRNDHSHREAKTTEQPKTRSGVV